ncbi:branched-chain amino acid ABC transporter permease [Hydrogenibacillus schlegelii]|uniref:Branched-chain amino acid ABC transporter permease n=2 Tax=Hydrogenibacillus schlegelii TaxID=1484 RepID=A0A2T5GCL9_HYDSH|nr:branched-chain amino acid ABC transporter permease [Hydrogenibacillus schlegelii]MBE3562650.1 branched-chain amino acid ABC transporter permease [Hydrogenibacillus schlegelii]MBT9282481.1 branched-chain amino acid ABC transporter permease [Hydrogenibacillus schlegelii]PTQ53933.1 MAG: High-affinity branched-chain amino acid transport system permease protein LivH [Hydrogenibacillus schlegelii]
MNVWGEQLMNALVIGSFYSLIALGYSMVYGIIQLLNFAHGDVYMVGAFVGYGVLSAMSGAPLFVGLGAAFLFASLATGLLGLGVERIAYRPLLQSSRLVMLITAIGVSLVLENGVMLALGPSFRVMPVELPRSGLSLFGADVTYAQLAIIATSVGLMLLLDAFVRRTLYGKAMRAIAVNPTATALMGIPVHRVIALTFFIGSFLAGSAGVLAGVYYGKINFMMGFIVGLKAFTASVLGGIGSLPGAMLGGYLLGFLETFGAAALGGEWKDVFAFVILILILTLKPTGLLGRTGTERV